MNYESLIYEYFGNVQRKNENKLKKEQVERFLAKLADCQIYCRTIKTEVKIDLQRNENG